MAAQVLELFTNTIHVSVKSDAELAVGKAMREFEKAAKRRSLEVKGQIYATACPNVNDQTLMDLTVRGIVSPKEKAIINEQQPKVENV